MSVEYRVATVVDVVDNSLQMVDHATGTTFSIPSSAPGAVGALPGDQWILDMSMGTWALKQCILKAPLDARPDRSLREIIDTLRSRQLISTAFEDADDPEGLHLAKIGEVRYISYAPDSYFWPEADGATVSRLKYRELGNLIAPGTSDTFDLPCLPIMGTVRPYVCAR